jgi:hypothetical protein
MVHLLLPDEEGVAVGGSFEIVGLVPIRTDGAVLGAAVGRRVVCCGVAIDAAGGGSVSSGFKDGVCGIGEGVGVFDAESTTAGLGGNASVRSNATDSSANVDAFPLLPKGDSSIVGGLAAGKAVYFEGLVGDFSGVRVNPVLSNRFDFADKKVVSRSTTAISSLSSARCPGYWLINGEAFSPERGGSTTIGATNFSRPNFF